MNEYIKLYKEKRKKKLKEEELAKKKYDSLSLVDRNAYQQIIERKENRGGLLFSLPFKGLFYIGVFFIVFSIMSGIPIETFQLAFLSLVRPMVIATLLFLMIDFLGMAFDSYYSIGSAIDSLSSLIKSATVFFVTLQ